MERWTSEVQFLLNPTTRDLQWGVHNELAKMRGGHLQSVLAKLQNGDIDYFLPFEVTENYRKGDEYKTIKDAFNKLLTPLFEMAGSANGTHVLNCFHDAFRHIFRTYEGEVRSTIHPYSLFGSMFQKYCCQDRYIADAMNPEVFMEDCKSMIYAYFNTSVISTRALMSHEASGQLSSLGYLIYGGIGRHFEKPEELVERIYDAIYPELVPLENGTVDLKRTIQWESIAEWIGTFIEKLPTSDDEDFDPSTDFYQKHVKKMNLADTAAPYLTKEGVRLMLWDMGILEHTNESKQMALTRIEIEKLNRQRY